MSVVRTVRKFVASLIASNKLTRVFFKRIAMDERLIASMLDDPKFQTRVLNSRTLRERLEKLLLSRPLSEMPTWFVSRLPGAAQAKAPREASPSAPLPVPKDASVHPITDISLNIEWGPRAFPLTRHAVYLREGTRHLTERWLRRLSSDACVALLADPAAMGDAQDFRARFRQVKEVCEVPLEVPGGGLNEDFAQRVAGFRQLDAIAVPLPVQNKPIEFIPDNTLPDIGPHYSMFRGLWRAGFRQFAMLGFGGFRQFEMPVLLDSMEGIHQGRRCFIAGNGPSLNQLDMKRLKDEITFGSNRCYMGFEDWGYAFRYWSCVDRLQVEEYGLEYQDHLPRETTKFLPFEYVPLLQFPNMCPINFEYTMRPPYKFSNSPEILYLGFTVTYTLIQIAALMGCNPIYLIGVDHRYNLNPKTVQDRTFGTLKAKIWVAEDASRPTHFTEKYTAGDKPKLFVTPKPERAEACFQVAREWTEQHGIQVLNATPNTGLDVFDKVDFNTLF